MAHPFPTDILLRTPQQIAERLRLGEPFFHGLGEWIAHRQIESATRRGVGCRWG
jgi:hypothetical protein